MRKDFPHIGYAPSILRGFPCLRIGDELIAPIPDLLFNRFTEQLFYDFAGDDKLKNEFSKNFETYLHTILRDHANEFQICGEENYNNGQSKTPDAFAIKNQTVSIAFEAKSRKMSALAKFGENPLVEAESAFSEIAKGICQLWRYVVDSGRGLVPDSVRCGNSTHLLLVTLDDWLGGLSVEIRKKLFSKAHQLADGKSIPKSAEIRRPVLICAISDIEFKLTRGQMDGLEKILNTAKEEKYRDWMLQLIWNDVFPDSVEGTFVSMDRLETVWPWWGELKKKNRP